MLESYRMTELPFNDAATKLLPKFMLYSYFWTLIFRRPKFSFALFFSVPFSLISVFLIFFSLPRGKNRLIKYLQLIFIDSCQGQIYCNENNVVFINQKTV